MTAIIGVSGETCGMSFASFYKENRVSVARGLSVALGDSELGFEAADEAMVRAYRQWGVVAKYQNPSGWVYRSGKNWALSVLRRRANGRNKMAFISSDVSGPDLLPDTDLGRAIANLSPNHREIVVMRFFDDLSLVEMARRADLPLGTIKSRLSRALEQLANSADLVI